MNINPVLSLLTLNFDAVVFNGGWTMEIGGLLFVDELQGVRCHGQALFLVPYFSTKETGARARVEVA